MLVMNFASSCPLLPRVDVALLLGRHLVYVYVERLELESGDLPVDLLGDDINLVLELSMILRDVFGRERLVREAHVHDGRRMSLCSGQVHEPAPGHHVPLLVAQVVLLNFAANFAATAACQLTQCAKVE